MSFSEVFKPLLNFLFPESTEASVNVRSPQQSAAVVTDCFASHGGRTVTPDRSSHRCWLFLLSIWAELAHGCSAWVCAVMMLLFTTGVQSRPEFCYLTE